MSGVIAAMRRTLLSCTSLVRDGLVGLTASAALASAAFAAEQPGTLTRLFALDHQEIAALMLAPAILGFSVLATFC